MMTREEIFREVRAQVTWGNAEQRIRADLLKKGANAADLEDALRAHIAASDRRFRLLGLAGIAGGLALIWLSWPMLMVMAPEPADAQPAFGSYRGRSSKAAAGIGLFLAGLVVASVGGHRLLTGGRSDRH